MTAAWPFPSLRVVTPLVELRWPSYDDLLALADVAADGVHDPDVMPFLVPWTRQPAVERGRAAMQWAWRTWGELTRDSWRIHLAVVRDGVVVGVQDLEATHFAVTREVTTGSWLGRAHHGRGTGTEMRAAALHLAFAGLGALSARTSAFADNAASLGVTRRIGYEPDGVTVFDRGGGRVEDLRFRLDRARWEQRVALGHHHVEAEIHGLTPDALSLLGAD